MPTTLFNHKPVLHGLFSLCLCGLLVSTPLGAKEVHASATEELPAFDAALNTLFGDANPGLVRPVAPRVQAGHETVMSEEKLMAPMRVVVKPGDTVDVLLRRHLGESAFSQKFLRQAVIRLNPAAFPQGNIHRLESGSTLLLPSEQTLVGLLTTKAPGAVSMPLNRASQPQEAEGPSSSTTPAAWQATQKNWVRYP